MLVATKVLRRILKGTIQFELAVHPKAPKVTQGLNIVLVDLADKNNIPSYFEGLNFIVLMDI